MHIYDTAILFSCMTVYTEHVYYVHIYLCSMFCVLAYSIDSALLLHVHACGHMNIKAASNWPCSNEINVII